MLDPRISKVILLELLFLRGGKAYSVLSKSEECFHLNFGSQLYVSSYCSVLFRPTNNAPVQNDKNWAIHATMSGLPWNTIS